MGAMLRALWNYRGFILGSVRREFQTKYRNSLLGAAWTVLNPLALISVYTVVFAEVMRARLPNAVGDFAYSIYLCAGLLTWGLFAEIISRSQSVFIDHANLLKKLSFPRMCLPVVIVFSSILNFAIVFSLFTGFLIISGNFPGGAYWAIFPLLGLLVLFSIGIGITVGVLNVFFRDVGQFFGIFLTFWFWLTPIVYPVSALPDEIRKLMAWNPMSALMDGFQQIFVANRWPQWEDLWPIGVLAVILCATGLGVFRRHAGEMVDEL